MSKVIKQPASRDSGVDAYTPGEIHESKRGPGPAPAHVEQQAYQKGFQSGEQAGRQEGLKKIKTLEKVLSSMLDELKTLRQDTVKSAEQDILKIALAVARRILRQEVSHDPDRILGYIREAAKKIGPAESLLIRLHPQDLERIARERAEIIRSIEGLKWLKLQPAPELLPGECVIEGRDRTLDARIDSQLRTIEEALNRDGQTS